MSTARHYAALFGDPSPRIDCADCAKRKEVKAKNDELRTLAGMGVDPVLYWLECQHELLLDDPVASIPQPHMVQSMTTFARMLMGRRRLELGR